MHPRLEPGQPARPCEVEGRAGDQDQEGHAVEEVAHFDVCMWVCCGGVVARGRLVLRLEGLGVDVFFE